MATAKDKEKDPEAIADQFGADQVKAAFDEAQKVGYFGNKVDPLPNSAHSLESGPDAPTVDEQASALADAAAKENG